MSDDADERERAEAEALARALERTGAAGDAADGASVLGSEAQTEALEAAALLRYGGADGALRPERADALLDRLLPQVEALAAMKGRAAPRTGARAPARPRRLWRLAPAGLGVMAAAASLWLALAPPSMKETAGTVLLAPPPPAQDSVGSAAGAPGHEPVLPAPPARLLAAQAAQAGESAARDRAAFDTEMRAYREQVLRALERAYPARLGMLDPGARR